MPDQWFPHFRDEMKILATEGREYVQARLEFRVKLLASKAVGFVSRTFPRALKTSIVPPRDLGLATFPCFH